LNIVIHILSLISTAGLILEVDKAFGEYQADSQQIIEIADPAINRNPSI